MKRMKFIFVILMSVFLLPTVGLSFSWSDIKDVASTVAKKTVEATATAMNKTIAETTGTTSGDDDSADEADADEADADEEDEEEVVDEVPASSSSTRKESVQAATSSSSGASVATSHKTKIPRKKNAQADVPPIKVGDVFAGTWENRGQKRNIKILIESTPKLSKRWGNYAHWDFLTLLYFDGDKNHNNSLGGLVRTYSRVSYYIPNETYSLIVNGNNGVGNEWMLNKQRLPSFKGVLDQLPEFSGIARDNGTFKTTLVPEKATLDTWLAMARAEENARLAAVKKQQEAEAVERERIAQERRQAEEQRRAEQQRIAKERRAIEERQIADQKRIKQEEERRQQAMIKKREKEPLTILRSVHMADNDITRDDFKEIITEAGGVYQGIGGGDPSIDSYTTSGLISGTLGGMATFVTVEKLFGDRDVLASFMYILNGANQFNALHQKLVNKYGQPANAIEKKNILGLLERGEYTWKRDNGKSAILLEAEKYQYFLVYLNQDNTEQKTQSSEKRQVDNI